MEEKLSNTQKMQITKEKWAKIHLKKQFIVMCADLFGRSMQTIAANWFSRFYQIPDTFYKKVILLLDDEIAKQKKNNKN